MSVFSVMAFQLYDCCSSLLVKYNLASSPCRVIAPAHPRRVEVVSYTYSYTLKDKVTTKYGPISRQAKQLY